MEILFTYDSVEAEIVKDLLQSEGIKVVEQSSKISPYPVNIGTMGEIKLLVRDNEYAGAKAVLETMQQSGESE